MMLTLRVYCLAEFPFAMSSTVARRSASLLACRRRLPAISLAEFLPRFELLRHGRRTASRRRDAHEQGMPMGAGATSGNATCSRYCFGAMPQDYDTFVSAFRR